MSAETWISVGVLTALIGGALISGALIARKSATDRMKLGPKGERWDGSKHRIAEDTHSGPYGEYTGPVPKPARPDRMGFPGSLKAFLALPDGSTKGDADA